MWTEKGSEEARDTGKSSQRTRGKVMLEGNFPGWNDLEVEERCSLQMECHELRPGGKMENGILAIGRDQHC